MIQWKDAFYNEFLKDPSKDTFSRFLKNNVGEMDNIDFKEKWTEKGKLAKTILSIANSRGGIIAIGIKENEDGSLTPLGLDKFKDKADIGKELSKYISPNLDFNVLDFDYDTPIYPDAENKKFQIILISDTPDRLPFVSLGATTDLEKDIIYVRRGTKCEKASAEEIEKIISAKVETIFKDSSDLTLEKHLEQLKLLYKELPEKISKLVKAGKNGWAFNLGLIGLNCYKAMMGDAEYETIDNPHYPKESYEAFIARMIEKKKLKIEKVLDLK